MLARAQLGQFSRASRDEFVYPRLPYLGELIQVSGAQTIATHASLCSPLSHSLSSRCFSARASPRSCRVQLRVGTDGQGMFATWHLKLVEVTHLSTGTVWRFHCHDWVDKNCGWQRVLIAQRHPLAA